MLSNSSLWIFNILTVNCLVKFEGDKLPAILNAIETDNNGQKLVLEVAVRSVLPLNFAHECKRLTSTATHG